MRRHGRSAPGAMLVLTLAAGCGSPVPSTAGLVALPTVSFADGGCRGIGLEGTLAGDPSDARVAWVATAGGRLDVLFPRGFAARFTPRLEVLDENGSLVAQEGTAVSGGCVTGPDAQGPPLILSH